MTALAVAVQASETWWMLDGSAGEAETGGEWGTARFFATVEGPVDEKAGVGRPWSYEATDGLGSETSDLGAGSSAKSFYVEICNNQEESVDAVAHSRLAAAKTSPEPSCALLTLIGLACLALRRRA